MGSGNDDFVTRTPVQVKEDLSLDNVTNEAKATMFTDPTFTGKTTISGSICTTNGSGIETPTLSDNTYVKEILIE